MVHTSAWASSFLNGTMRSRMDSEMVLFRCCEAGVETAQMPISAVPGAFELPLAAKWMLEGADPCDAVIAIGAVIRGETAHFDYVCQGVTQGLMQLSLDSGKPAIFCVLTDDNIEQSRARSGGEHGNKGIEAAIACLKMLALKNQKATKS